MRERASRLRELVRGLLQNGEIRMFIGYERGFSPYRPVPYFVTEPEGADALLVDETCANNLSKYLLEEALEDGRVGILVKGCDSLGVERLLKDNRIAREKVLLVGVPCTGVLDHGKLAALDLGEIEDVRDEGDSCLIKGSSGDKRLGKLEYLLPKCVTCDVKNPVGCDHMLGDPVDSSPLVARDFAEVLEIEGLTPEERKAYWDRQFARCIRCFACRNVCPACNCRECCLDQTEPRWIGREVTLSEQQMFHFIRAMDVAGRCIDCGECERACPVGIPLMKLNRKFLKDIGQLFGIDRPYVPAEVEPLGRYHPEDPDEFN